MTLLVAAWLFLALFFWLFIAAADGARWLWLHLLWPPHRQRMKRAELCLEAAEHFGGPVAKTWIRQAYRLCDDCGCPADLWPAQVVAIHAGAPHA